MGLPGFYGEVNLANRIVVIENWKWRKMNSTTLVNRETWVHWTERRQRRTRQCGSARWRGWLGRFRWSSTLYTFQLKNSLTLAKNRKTNCSTHLTGPAWREHRRTQRRDGWPRYSSNSIEVKSALSVELTSSWTDHGTFFLTLLGPPGDPGTVSDVSERRSFEDEFGMIVARKGEKGDQVGAVIKKNTR